MAPPGDPTLRPLLILIRPHHLPIRAAKDSTYAEMRYSPPPSHSPIEKK